MTRDLQAIERAHERAERHGLAEEASYSHEAIGALLAENRALRRALAQEIRDRYPRTVFDYREMMDYVQSEHDIHYWPDLEQD